MKNILTYITGLIVLFLQACAPPSRPVFPNLKVQHERGLAENPQRISLGMRPIDAKWTCFRSTGAGDEWIIDPVNDNVAAKVVIRNSEKKAQTEIDTYVSGRKFKENDDEGELDEEFKVSCSWSSGVITLIYIGADDSIEKSVARLPAFSPDTKQLYLDLVKEITTKKPFAK